MGDQLSVNETDIAQRNWGDDKQIKRDWILDFIHLVARNVTQNEC